MILPFLFYCVIAYLLYRLVFNFILPIFRTTQQIRRGFRGMKEQMNAQMNSQPGASQPYNKPQEPKAGGSQVGEYIDFEEV